MMSNREDAQLQSQLARWMGGFSDGDGCIQLAVAEDERQQTGHAVKTSFRINQHYAAGFVDAEGHVKTEVAYNETSQTNHTVTAKVSFNQINSKKKLLEERYSEFCERHGIEYKTYSKEIDRENWSNMYEFRICKRDSVRRFLEIVHPYLVIKKPQSEIMLNEILPRLERGDHLNRRGFLRVIAYRELMNSYKGSERGKYNVEYFEDLWGIELDRSALDLEKYTK